MDYIPAIMEWVAAITMLKSLLCLGPKPPRTGLTIMKRARLSAHRGGRIFRMSVLVTGASGGIGRATAVALARTVPTDPAVRSEDSLAQVRSEIERQHPVEVRTFAVDLMDTQAVRQLIDRCRDWMRWSTTRSQPAPIACRRNELISMPSST